MSYIEIMRINFTSAAFQHSWYMLILWLVFLTIWYVLRVFAD